MKFAYLIEPPFNYRTADGLVTGCDVELARIVLNRIGITDFEPIETEFAELLPGVSQDKWRMTTGLFATEERRKMAAFSRPIWALPDGLLIPHGNPNELTGYKSVADAADCRLAVIRDQFQHRSAIEFGVPAKRILVFETYAEAARSVLEGEAHAYASVARAHTGYISQCRAMNLDVVTIPNNEKQPAFGSFAFNTTDDELRNEIDLALTTYLGSTEHRAMMHPFGFTDSEIDLMVNAVDY